MNFCWILMINVIEIDHISGADGNGDARREKGEKGEKLEKLELEAGMYVLQLKRPNLPHFSPLFVCLYILPENSGYGNYLANNYLDFVEFELARRGPIISVKSRFFQNLSAGTFMTCNSLRWSTGI